jgi:hypothetical protein
MPFNHMGDLQSDDNDGLPFNPSVDDPQLVNKDDDVIIFGQVIQETLNRPQLRRPTGPR